jgi:hypothetical protein
MSGWPEQPLLPDYWGDDRRQRSPGAVHLGDDAPGLRRLVALHQAVAPGARVAITD